MGRRKREVKRIEDKIARQVTFSKRRNGLLKKANELSVLCDVEVAAMIFCDRGKLYDYCSSSSLPEMLRRYHSSVEAEPSSSTGVLQNQQDQCSKYEGFLTSGELLQIVERDLEEPFIDQLSVNDLQHLENQVVEALIQTRSTKTCLLLDSVSSLKEKEKSSEEANRLLKEKISGNKRPQVGQQTKVVIDLNVLADDQATEGEQILKY